MAPNGSLTSEEEKRKSWGGTWVLDNLGIQIRYMKMAFNFYGTWRRVMFEKLMMKIYDFFYSAKSFSHPI